MHQQKRTLTAFGGAIVGAVLASACCLGPVVVAALGVGSASFASIFEPYRPYLLGLTALLLGAAFYLTYRRRPSADCLDGSACHQAWPSRRRQILLWSAAALVIGVSTYPYWINAHAGLEGSSVRAQAPPSQRLTELTITGMTCAGCAAHVRHALEAVPGVAHAGVTYEDGTASVTVEKDVPVQRLVDAVASAGYEATPRGVRDVSNQRTAHDDNAAHQ